MSIVRPLSQSIGLFALLVLVFSGCSPPPVAADLTGTVTFDGQQVEEGQIYVIPDKSKGNEGRTINTGIKNGKYEIRAVDRPMPSGAVVVEIQVAEKGGMYINKSNIDLPKGTGTMDFAVKKTESKFVPPLAAPGNPGGGGEGKGKGRGRGKEAKDRDKIAEEKTKPADEKAKDTKAKDEKPKDKDETSKKSQDE